MIATLLPQLKDRTTEVESDQLSGSQKKVEQDRFQKLIDGLKERVEALKDASGKEERTEYVKKVEEAFHKFKAAKPGKDVDTGKDEPEPAPAPEPVKVEEPKKEEPKKEEHKKKEKAPAA